MDIYLNNRAIGGKISNISKVRSRLDKTADDMTKRNELVYGKSNSSRGKEDDDEK